MSDSPDKAWLAISWRQYLYWFAEFEFKIDNNLIIPKDFLQNVENNWSHLESQNVLFDERQNNGNWIRAWRIVINNTLK
jgi:hypothetical protein